MKLKLALLITGVIAASLGLLWFLQGSDIVHLQPILCFANCEVITGKSLAWQIIGSIVFIGGLIPIVKSIQEGK